MQPRRSSGLQSAGEGLMPEPAPRRDAAGFAGVLLGLATIGVPLAIVPGLFFHWDTVPRIVLLCLLAAMMLLRLRLAEEVGTLCSVRVGRLLALVAGAQVLWFSMVSLLTTRPWFSWLGNNWRRMGAVTILAFAIFAICAAGIMAHRPSVIRLALRGNAIAAFVVSGYGIAQYFDRDPLQNPVSYHAQAGDLTIVRPPGTFGHADYFGWWLAVSVFSVIAMTRQETRGWRSFGFAATALCTAAIVLTGTRAAMVAALAGLLCMALTGKTIQWKRYAGIAALVLAATALFYISPAGERLRARVQWVNDEPLGGARLLLWRDSLRMAAAHPVAGTGPETFAAAFPAYQSIELSQLLPDTYHESPHNAVLDALAEQGIPGAFLMCTWIAVGLWSGHKARRAGSPRAPALMAALVASVTAGIFGVATAGPVFATLLAIAILTALAAQPASAGNHPLGNRRLAWAGLLAIPLTVFAIALAVSDSALARAASVPASVLAATPRLRPAAIPGAGEDMFWSRHLSAACSSATAPVPRAECMRLATLSAARATGTADNPAVAWYNLAIFTSAIGDSAGVERALRTSIRMAPNWFKPHWSLANLLIVTGRTNEAIHEAERAVALDGGKDTEVTATLQRARSAR